MLAILVLICATLLAAALRLWRRAIRDCWGFAPALLGAVCGLVPAPMAAGGSAGGAVAMVWFDVAMPRSAGADDSGRFVAGTGGTGVRLWPAALAAAGADPGDDEDRRAVLGAAFLAEVMGPRPRIPKGISRGAAGLRDLIASVEAGAGGYDAVVYGARVQPPLPPSRMTIAGIEAWIAATPGQNHAIGRYQIVPRTLQVLVKRLSLPAGTRFTPAIQDRLADVLIADAGYHEFRAGMLGRTAFMENLAMIWAGLPRADGRSAYHGFNGNRAGMSWAAYRQGMARAFPE